MATFEESLDDILGISPKEAKRKKQAEYARKSAAKKAGNEFIPDKPPEIKILPPEAAEDLTPEMLRYSVPQTLAELHSGVSVTFLSELFSMSRNVVTRRLRECAPVRRIRKAPVYDIREAAGYLVEPKMDIEEVLKSLKPEELPTKLQKDFWDAQLKRQKWRVEAGELWDTDLVREAFGEVFKLIKTSIQLWSDEVERLHGLTTEQRAVITESADNLQDDIYNELMAWADRDTKGNVADNEDAEGGEVEK